MIVDAHHHFWNLEREAQPWMTDEHAVIRRTFEPVDLEPLLEQAGVDATVLVQSACSDLDTDSMFEQASEHAWIGGVIAWLDLRSPDRAAVDSTQLRPSRSCGASATSSTTSPTRTGFSRRTVLASLALLEESAD